MASNGSHRLPPRELTRSLLPNHYPKDSKAAPQSGLRGDHSLLMKALGGRSRRVPKFSFSVSGGTIAGTAAFIFLAVMALKWPALVLQLT